MASWRPRSTSASPSVGVRSGGPSQAASSSARPRAGAPFAKSSPAMRHLPLCFLLLTLFAACTDRLAPSDDPWGRGGELIAMGGGDGGARYACVSCHGARGEGNGFDAPRLAGLPAGYLQKQMEDYAAGLRPHAVMRDVAR